MRWLLRDGFRNVWVVDSFWDREKVQGQELAPAIAATLLHSLSSDPLNADTLRDIHAARPGAGQTRPGSAFDDPFGTSRSPLAATVADVFAGKLAVILGPEPEATTQEPATIPLEVEEEATPLVTRAPEPEPEVPPDVIAQVAALQRASQLGAPFCEE